MRKMTKVGIICFIIPLGIATTVGVTFLSLGVFDSIDLGERSLSTINVGALSKRELIVSEFFWQIGQPACKGTITLQNTESGATIVKSYSFNSNSIYMETVSERFVVDLEPGEWTINHQQTSGDGELEIKSTFCGSQDLDIGGLIAWWVFAGIMAIAGIVIIKNEMDKDKASSSSFIDRKYPEIPPRRLVFSSVEYDTICLTCGRLIRAGSRCQHCY